MNWELGLDQLSDKWPEKQDEYSKDKKQMNKIPEPQQPGILRHSLSTTLQFLEDAHARQGPATETVAKISSANQKLKHDLWGAKNRADAGMSALVNRNIDQIENPKFITALGNAKGAFADLKLTLKQAGLNTGKYDLLDAIDDSRTYIKENFPGQHFFGRLDSKDTDTIVNSTILQAIIRHSKLSENFDINEVEPLIIDKMNTGLRVKFQGSPKQYLADINDLRSLWFDGNSGVNTKKYNYTDKAQEVYGDSFTLGREYKIALKWYTHITGQKPPEDMTMTNLLGTIGSMIDAHNKWHDRAVQKVKYNRLGYDVPLTAFHADGRLEAGESPLMAKEAAKFFDYYSNNISVSKDSKFSYEYAGAQLGKDIQNMEPEQFLTEKLGLRDLSDDKKVLLHGLADWLTYTKGNSGERLPVQERLKRLRDGIYQPFSVYSEIKNDVNTAIQRLKHQYAVNYALNSEAKLKEKMAAEGYQKIDIEKARQKAYVLHEKLNERRKEYEKSVAPDIISRMFMNTINIVEKGMKVTGLSKITGAFDEGYRPLLSLIYDAKYSNVPKEERIPAGQNPLGPVAALKEKLNKTIPLADTKRLIQEYNDKIKNGTASVWDYISEPFRVITSGLINLPIQAIDRPADFMVFTKALQAAGGASGVVSKTLAKNHPIMAGVTALIAEPHNAVPIIAKKLGSVSLDGYMKYGQTVHSFKKRLNTLSPEGRSLFMDHFNNIKNTTIKFSPGSKEGLENLQTVIGQVLAEDHHVTRSDIKKIGNIAGFDTIPYEAQRYIFNMWHGDTRLLDGAISDSLAQQEVALLTRTETEILNGTYNKSEAPLKGPIGVAQDLFQSFNESKIQGQTKILRSLQNKGYVGNLAKNMADYIVRRNRVESNTIFDTDAFRGAVEENVNLIKATHKKRKALKFLYNNLTEEIKPLLEELDNLKGIEDNAIYVRAKEILEQKKKEFPQYADKFDKISFHLAAGLVKDMGDQIDFNRTAGLAIVGDIVNGETILGTGDRYGEIHLSKNYFVNPKLFANNFFDIVVHEIGHILEPTEHHSELWAKRTQELGGSGKQFHNMGLASEADAARQARIIQLQEQLGTRGDQVNALSYDIKTMDMLMNSRIADVNSHKISPDFKRIEKGWKSVLGGQHRAELNIRIAKMVLNSPQTAHNLIDLPQKTIAKIFKIRAEFDKRFGKETNYEKIRADYKKTVEQVKRAIGDKQFNKMYSDKPSKPILHMITEKKNEINHLIDIVRGITNRNPNSVMAAPISSILGTITARSGGHSLGRFMRLKIQRIDSISQDLLARTIKHADRIADLSDTDKQTLSELTRLPIEELNKDPNYGKLHKLAAEIIGTNNILLDEAVNVGRITIGEARRMKAQGYDPHFYLKIEHARELRGYQEAKPGMVSIRDVEAPTFGRLNMQRRPGVARVAFRDATKGEWTIKDFEGASNKESIKMARDWMNQIKEKYPKLDKDHIKMVTPLTQIEMATKGVISNDIDYQIRAMRNMITDIGRAKLLNEVGMMQGLVRTNIDNIENPKERSLWVPLFKTGRKSEAYRRSMKYKWGAMAGKYVHKKFFDFMNSWDDYSSVLHSIADLMRQEVDNSTFGNKSAINALMGDINKATNWKVSKWANRMLRQTLIAMNPVSYVHNFGGATMFSYFAGANVMGKNYWKAHAKFNELLQNMGTENYRFTEDRDMHLFKFAASHGLIERTGAALSEGGNLHLSAKMAGVKPWQIKKILKKVDTEYNRDIRNVNSRIKEYKQALDRISTILKLSDIEGEQSLTARERFNLERSAEAFSLELKEREKELFKIRGSYDLRVAQTKAAAFLRGMKHETKKGLTARPDSVVGQVFSEMYGAVDPKHKWAAFHNLVTEKHYGMDEALQLVLDHHQNYGAMAPWVRKVKMHPLGAFVPAFGVESARIIANGLKTAPGRILAPLLLPAIHNNAMLMSQGLLPSDYANQMDTDNDWDTFKKMTTQFMVPVGRDQMMTLDISQFSPFASFFQSPAAISPMIKQVQQQMGSASLAVVPLLNYVGQFGLNNPFTDLGAKYLYGVDPFTGKATYMQGNLPEIAGNLAGDITKLITPSMITRPYSEIKRYRSFPNSRITKKNVSAIETLLRMGGFNIDVRSGSRARAELALSYANKSLREGHIKDYLTRNIDNRRDLYLLGAMKIGSPEWKEQLAELAKVEMDNKKGTITIGGSTFSENMDGMAYKKAALNVINLASKNIYNTLEEMKPDRRIRYAHAVFNTWGDKNKEYQHTIETLTNPKYTKGIGSINDVVHTFIYAHKTMVNTINPKLKQTMNVISAAMIQRGSELLRSRKHISLGDVISATKGKQNRRLAQFFLNQLY